MRLQAVCPEAKAWARGRDERTAGDQERKHYVLERWSDTGCPTLTGIDNQERKGAFSYRQSVVWNSPTAEFALR